MNDAGRLAVAIDDQNITIAWVDTLGRLLGQRCWAIARFGTLTDALLAFGRESDTPLLGAACAIGVLGATEGETIMLSRGSWAISRSSLRGVFGRDPLVMNDVAARAWAACGRATVRREALCANPPRGFDRPGRWTLSKIDAGVGLAVIDVDEGGTIAVHACEMGHVGFAAVTAEDRALALALAGSANRLVSWEMVLTLGLDDPAWARPGLPAGRSDRAAMLTRLAGRYLGDVTLAHGAWAGALLTGRRGAELAGRAPAPAFNAAFEGKPKFGKLLRATPRSLLNAEGMTLHGCAVALARAERGGLARAA